MSNKFTEEQYQKIIEKWDGEISYIEATKAVVSYLAVEDLGYSISNQALALANPLTREWAHDKFVEKEKKYVWRSKIENSAGEEKRLYDTADGISDSFIDKDTPSHNGNRITETEVKKWGYNPEIFNKDEV